MIITAPFLFLFLKCLVESSEIDQMIQVQKSNPPILKNDDIQFPINQFNVVLQSLYAICPFRNSVFDHSSTEISGLKALNSLELAFGRMYFNQETRREPTESAIYFEKSYLESKCKPLLKIDEPKFFYNWLTQDLFKFPEYRELLQWNILSTKTNSESKNEIITEEQFNQLNVETCEYSSIKSFIEDILKEHTENIISTSEGTTQTASMKHYKTITKIPKIPSFYLSRSFDESIEESSSTSIFLIEDSLKISDKSFNLVSVILFNQKEERFSTCVKLDNQWHQVQGETSQKVTTETVLSLASKFGRLIFYLDQSDSSSCVPISPSQQLIMNSSTYNTIHNIKKSVHKHSNAPQVKSSLHLTKSKNMLLHQSNFYYGEKPFVAQSSSLNSNLHPFPSKSSPLSESEFADINSILIPDDLSDVKMNLITTGPFTQNDSESNYSSEISPMEYPKKQNDFKTFNEEIELELEYVNERSRSSTFKRSHQDSSDIASSKENEFSKDNSSLVKDNNHDCDYNDDLRVKSKNSFSNSENVDTFGNLELLDEDSQIFLQASLATKIKKYYRKDDSFVYYDCDCDEPTEFRFKNVNDILKPPNLSKYHSRSNNLFFKNNKSDRTSSQSFLDQKQHRTEALEPPTNAAKDSEKEKDDKKKNEKKFIRSKYANF